MGHSRPHIPTVPCVVCWRLLSCQASNETGPASTRISQSKDLYYHDLDELIEFVADCLQWLVPRAQCARFQTHFAQPQNDFSFYQAQNSNGNGEGYGMQAFPPPGTLPYYSNDWFLLTNQRTTKIMKPLPHISHRWVRRK